MQIKSYNRKELGDYIQSDFFRTLPEIPISIHRAISQINNPYCSNEDILLWAAYENGLLIGYVGVLPDVIGLNNKVYWLSCFWVHETFRNDNLASLLFFSLVKQYKNQLFISNFLFSLEKTYQSLGIFQPTQYNYGSTFFINFCFTEILQARFPKIKVLRPIFDLIEKIFNLTLKTRKIFFKNKKNTLDIIEDKNLNEEFQSFLNAYFNSNETVARTIEHFRWIFTFPWIIEGKKNKESERYFFSSMSYQFEYKLLKIYSQQKLEGIVLLKTRDKNMSISYLYTYDSHIRELSDYLLKLAISENINTITVFDKRLISKLLNRRNNFIYIKDTKRPYIFPQNFKIDSSVFQEGDGDSVFT